MDGHSFDILTRALSATPSRRALGRALAGLTMGGLPGFLRSAGMDAGRRKNKRRRRRRRKNRPHVCEGRDACLGGLPTCSSSDPNCYCFVDAEGDPICAKGNTVDTCEQCQQQFPGRLCFPGTAHNAVLLAASWNARSRRKVATP
jgi:hypothetical protein